MSFKNGRRALLLAASAVALLIFGVGTAVAVFPDTDVTTYTGCLVSGGVINSVKEGSSPSQPCSSPKMVVKLSGGDITKVEVTGALTGGGANGAVTIGLDPKATVPSNCANGQLVRWNGTTDAWVCRDKYAATNGVDLGADDKTFSVNPSYRLPQTCSTGQSPSWNDTTEIWTCERFVEPSTCTSGQFATGANSSGAFTCAAPSTSSLSFVQSSQGAPFGVPDDGVARVLTEVDLTPGTWLLVGKGVLLDDGVTAPANSNGHCNLAVAGQGNVDTVDGLGFNDAESLTTEDVAGDKAFAVTAVVVVTATQKASVTCTATSGTDGVAAGSGKLVGVRIG